MFQINKNLWQDSLALIYTENRKGSVLDVQEKYNTPLGREASMIFKNILLCLN